MLGGRLRRNKMRRNNHKMNEDNKNEFVYKVSLIIILFVALFTNGCLFLISKIANFNVIISITIYILFNIIFLFPLLSLKLKITDSRVFIKLMIFQKEIIINDIIFAGKLWYSGHLNNRTMFTYGLVYLKNGNKEIISFPKLKHQKAMIQQIKKQNNNIEINLCMF